MNLQAINLLFEGVKVVDALTLVSPSTSTPDYVSMKGWRKCAMLMSFKSHATLSSAMVITVKQATAVAGTSEKALAFTKAYRNIDCGAADALAEFTVTSNTFTTDATAAKVMHYLIDIDVNTLDHANGFDCVRLGVADPANATVGFSATYFLYGGRYLSNPPPAAITD